MVIKRKVADQMYVHNMIEVNGVHSNGLRSPHPAKFTLRMTGYDGKRKQSIILVYSSG